MLKIVLKIFTLLFLFSFPIFSNSIEKADWEIEEIYIFQQKLNVSTPKITKNSIKTDSIEDKYILNSILERESNSKF
ncbi:MAG: hypothetical protein KDK36_20380, partial [Leptospiraceae bacterium]|nr:hypothetical protein [Leptospiraceae bacterium]